MPPHREARAPIAARRLGARAMALFALAVCGVTFAIVRSSADRPSFMGRTIAPTMTHHGADWLIRDERNAEENTDLLLEQLALEPGDVACDIGAGNGYHALRMARAVRPGGHVVAVDIQPEMLALLEARAEAAGIDGVKTRLGEPGDPKLAEGACDLVLLVDVYHEFSNPKAMLDALARALKPHGTIALVEFRAEDPSVPIKPLHKMTKARMTKELGSVGLEPVRSFDELPWQHLVFFAPTRGAKSGSTLNER